MSTSTMRLINKRQIIYWVRLLFSSISNTLLNCCYLINFLKYIFNVQLRRSTTTSTTREPILSQIQTIPECKPFRGVIAVFGVSHPQLVPTPTFLTSQPRMELLEVMEERHHPFCMIATISIVIQYDRKITIRNQLYSVVQKRMTTKLFMHSKTQVITC